jgi:predicted lipid-binding transport protein (Tim44 family)
MLPSAAQPAYPGGSLGGLFNRPGLIGGLAAGFLGAGLFGLLFGHGVVGELGSVASVLGLAFQLTLIVMLGRLIWTWWNIGQADAHAGLSPRQLADAYGSSRHAVLPDIDAGSSLDATDDGLGHPK